MKLPNYYGSISKLSGNRRKPYMVRISSEAEYDENKQDFVKKRITLGYYKTKKEALAALAEYNNNPFNPTDSNLTFAEAYKNYTKTKEYQLLSKSSIVSKTAAYKYCEKLYDIPVRELNRDMIMNVITSIQQGSSTKKNVLTIIRTVVDYAYDRNLITKKCTDNISIEYSDPTYERRIFTPSEIDFLWENSDQWDIKVLLILLYSGLRVNELLKNDRKNVNLEEKWIYVPKKLAKNNESIRYVPIHSKIFELVKFFYDNSIQFDKENLMVNPSGSVIMYNNFVARNLKRINKNFIYEHRFHDTRHTFATLGTQNNIPELYMQKLMGHTPSSILYTTYTHITTDELHKYIKMIP